MRLNKKVAIVTGACGGIGHAIVDKFVDEGASVIAVDLDKTQTETLAESYDGQVKGWVTDVTNFEQVQEMIEAAVEHFGTLDIVANNAGIGYPKLLLDHDPEEDFNLVTNVNQKGV